jgi:hypothetical protein
MVRDELLDLSHQLTGWPTIDDLPAFAAKGKLFGPPIIRDRAPLRV